MEDLGIGGRYTMFFFRFMHIGNPDVMLPKCQILSWKISSEQIIKNLAILKE